MNKNVYISLIAAAGVLCLSCEKEGLLSENGGSVMRVKTYYLDQPAVPEDAATRSTVSGGTVVWEVGDVINYYTGKTGRLSTIGSEIVQTSDSDRKSFSVTYLDGDTDIMFFLKGGSTGAVSNMSLSKFDIADAVPSNQDGTFSSNNILVRKASLTNNSVTLIPVQSFIKFKFGSLSFGDRTVNKITVKDLASSEAYVCGKLTVTPWAPGADPTSGSIDPGSGKIVQYGSTANLVTIDKSSSMFYADGRDYYVALAAKNYGSGLLITYYYAETGKADVKLAETKTPAVDLRITNGRARIINLKDLQDHHSKTVRSVEIFPKYAAFTKNQTKEIYLKVEPTDFRGTVTWSFPTGTARVDTPVYVEDRLIDGEIYKVYKITPTSEVQSADHTDYDQFTIKATLAAEDGSSEETGEVKINVGNFVDLGVENLTHRVLICRSKIKETNATTHKKELTKYCTDLGSTYYYGGTVPSGDINFDSVWIPLFGSKYNVRGSMADGLLEADDVASQWWGNQEVRIMHPSEFMSLSSLVTPGASTENGKGCLKLTSKVKFFEDAWVNVGCIDRRGSAGIYFGFTTRIKYIENGANACMYIGILDASGGVSCACTYNVANSVSVTPVRYIAK